MKTLLRNTLVIILPIIALKLSGEVTTKDIFGNPGRADKVVSHIGYVLGFSQDFRLSRWVGYKLTELMVETVVADRGNLNYYQDRLCNETSEGRIATLDFQRVNCHVGHLAPAQDMRWDADALRESFYFTNMSPQYPEFNTGGWKTLEKYIRGFSCTEGEIIVISGPVLPSKPDSRIGPQGRKYLTVPKKFYKVVYAPKSSKMIAFLIPHEKGKVLADPRFYAQTVDKIEEETGLDFFSDLPPGVQSYLESRIDLSQWTWLQK